ncbi:MAG: hypothetical protein KBD66_02070 [Candidatus Doudnabacteria bacterium]|nr:hypothetical protein [Candidatus Doudnabacteria bacterium]
MREQSFAPEELEKGALERIIEYNVEYLERVLCDPAAWSLVDGPPSRERATIVFYVTDTGHICSRGDAQAVFLCESVFIRTPREVFCFDIQFDLTSDMHSDVPNAIYEIISKSAEYAANQLEDFPRFISEKAM